MPTSQEKAARARSEAIKAFWNNPTAVQHAAKMFLALASVTDVSSELKRLFGLRVRANFFLSAYEGVSGRERVLRTTDPTISEDTIKAVLGSSTKKAHTRETFGRLKGLHAVRSTTPALIEKDRLTEFSKWFQKFLTDKRRKSSKKQFNAVVTVEQQYTAQENHTMLIIDVDAGIDRPQAVGWFNSFSNHLKTWAASKGGIDSCFDPLMFLNEKEGKVTCRVRLFIGGKQPASAIYDTSTGFMEWPKKR